MNSPIAVSVHVRPEDLELLKVRVVRFPSENSFEGFDNVEIGVGIHRVSFFLPLGQAENFVKKFTEKIQTSWLAESPMKEELTNKS